MALVTAKSKYYNVLSILSEHYKPGDKFTFSELHNIVDIDGRSMIGMCNRGLILKIGKIKRQRNNKGVEWVNQYTFDIDTYDKVLKIKKMMSFLEGDICTKN